MRHQRFVPENRISGGAAKLQLATLLCGCTDERLAGFSVESLAPMYRVKPADIGQMLAVERQRREARKIGRPNG